ncbi:MAG: BTAD domain-containing putative transcriptional regulator [Bellilinea sp.]
MALRDLVIQSQLVAPRHRRGILQRPRIQARLSSALDYPLTLVLAGTGYGKTTALTGLADLVDPLFWYVVTEPDRDPLLFLVNLISAFHHRNDAYGEAALRMLEENGGRALPAVLTPLLNTLTTGLTTEAVLVIDDYHLVQNVPEIGALVSQLIQYLPPTLHLVISSRVMPEHLDLNRWRIKGHLNTISHIDLAFTAEEIESLFGSHLGHPVTAEQARELAEETEGWVIALQMVGQSLERGSGRSLQDVLADVPDTLEDLFEYLAPEVLAHLPDELSDFMITTSVLRRLDGPVCDALRASTDSLGILHRLHESGLFLDSLGEDTYRYQRLFQDFLQSRLLQDPTRAAKLHRLAASYYARTSRSEETIFHLLKADQVEDAAAVLEQVGPDMVRTGRLESLMYWIGRLPEILLATHPHLQLLLGDALRLRADFDAALNHFMAADAIFQQQNENYGRSQALRGQAQVYLDTIRPLKADALLEEALRLLEPQEHRPEVAALLDQLAENKLNLGHPDQAESLHHEAQLLRAETNPNDVYLEGRRLLRTGHLSEARNLLEVQAAEERQAGQLRPQRFHRETLLLLSLVHAMMGEGESAERCARDGIEIGLQLQSDFVEAVGHMRLGHALQIIHHQPWAQDRRAEAARHYQRSIDQVNPFKVARVGVEPLWGLSRVLGYAGDIATAEKKAVQAHEIAEMAGDEWIGDLARTSMGASFALAGLPEKAERWLKRAAAGMHQVGDLYCWSAAMLWRAVNTWWSGDLQGAMNIMADLLPVVEQHGYEMLFTSQSLLGLKDEQAAIPLLLEARQRRFSPNLVNRLLLSLDAAGYETHPGYTLWARTLGSMAVWRGDVLINPGDWQREKARQLFQLLITTRGQWLLRDQIVDQLWPDLPAEPAQRDFKVALNALNHALEPARARTAPAYFVVRSDNMYGLNPNAHIRVDVDDFERYIHVKPGASQEMESLSSALRLYEDDFLLECRYEDWAAPERERLRHLYLSASERLSQLYIDQQSWDEVIQISNQTLAHDPLWEPAYRHLMQAHARKGNLAQVQATFNRLRDGLQRELGVDPSDETRQLLASLVQLRRKP